jgi:hypothetical protein
MDAKQLIQLQYTVGNMASYLGHTEGLFGMKLAGHHWVDGADYCYWPKDKSLRDFTEQECIDTLSHIHKWLQETHKSTRHYIRSTI